MCFNDIGSVISAANSFRSGHNDVNTYFDVVARRGPKTKVIGEFLYKNEHYDQFARRDFMVNAGLEQVVGLLANIQGSDEFSDFFISKYNSENQSFFDFLKNFSFNGNLYAMKEGEIFFPNEPQIILNDSYATGVMVGDLILSIVNPQSNIATIANDLSDIDVNKLLIEGGFKRNNSPLSAYYNSRGALIGGFHETSNLALNMNLDRPGFFFPEHSYILINSNEPEAFNNLGKNARNADIIFILDTFNVEQAIENAMTSIKHNAIKKFGFMVDSGNIVEQYHIITKHLGSKGIPRDKYTMIASENIDASKIKFIEEHGANYDVYRVGSKLIHPNELFGAVYKPVLAQYDNGICFPKIKLSSDISKTIYPGFKQIYRISGSDGMYKLDIIAAQNEDISYILNSGEKVEKLIHQVMTNGILTTNLPSIENINAYRRERLERFDQDYLSGKKEYKVTFSKNIIDMKKNVIEMNR